jgi:hypothetical protein
MTFYFTYTLAAKYSNIILRSHVRFGRIAEVTIKGAQ